MARDVGSFNLFYWKQRHKSLLPNFPGHCVVFFSTISLFFTLLYFTIFFSSFFYCWQWHSGQRASVNTFIGLYSILCFTFNTGTSLLVRAILLIGKHWTARLKCNCCFIAHKPVADTFFWSFSHITYWILLCNIVYLSLAYLIKYLHLNEYCKLRGPEKAFNFSRPFKWRLNLDVLSKAK